MLVLGRNVGQSVTMSGFRGGEEVTVMVVKHKPAGYRLGIDAPRHVQIVRDDALEREPRAHSPEDD